MTNEETRYSGSAWPQQLYRNEFLVECPKCSREAFVKVDSSFAPQKATLVCYNCHYAITEQALIRYRAIVKKSCENCGKEIRKTISNNKSKVLSLTVPCNNCGTVRTCKPRNEGYRFVKANTLPGDPIFNYSLWYQCTIKGNLLWAYNKNIYSK